MNLARIIAGAGLVLTASQAASDGSKSWVNADRCTLQVQLRALGSVSSAKRDWIIVQGHFHLYGACDTGPVSEGYSANVMALLSERWDLLDQLVTVAAGATQFLEFVLSHIDANATTEDLQQVQRNALSSCPSAHTGLCRQIAARATRALEAKTPPQGK